MKSLSSRARKWQCSLIFGTSVNFPFFKNEVLVQDAPY